MTVPFIEFQNVAFAYGARPILQNVSFAVEQGRFAAIMGGSGSGKTTLMRLITGQLRPSAGKVLLNGRDLGAFSAGELNEHRRRMGVLFQQGALFTDLNVFDNLAFPMRELTRHQRQCCEHRQALPAGRKLRHGHSARRPLHRGCRYRST